VHNKEPTVEKVKLVEFYSRGYNTVDCINFLMCEGSLALLG